MMEDTVSVSEEEIEDMEVDEDDERQLPSLPMEVWVQVFSYLSGPSLLRYRFYRKKTVKKRSG